LGWDNALALVDEIVKDGWELRRLLKSTNAKEKPMDVQEGRLAALKHAVERSLAADQRAIYSATAVGFGQSPQLSAAAGVVAEAEAFYQFLVGGSPKPEQAKTSQEGGTRYSFGGIDVKEDVLMQIERFHRNMADAALDELHRAMPAERGPGAG
jgi:hypothetical protein